MNKYNQPAKFDFLPHYRGNGLSPFILQLKYKNGSPVDLTGSHIRMDMKRYMMGVGWKFNSDGTGDSLLTIIDAENGKIQFPQIKSWGLAQGKYDYDLFICDSDGFARAYMRGVWRVNQNISKVPCSDVSGGSSSSYTRVQATNYDTETIEINGQTYEVEVILIEVDYQERGEKGDPFLYDDFTPAQIEDLKRPATEARDDYFDNVKPDALQAISDANTATSNADLASDRASTSADLADIATANAVQATDEAIDATADAILAAEKANNAKGWTPLTEFEDYNGKQIRKLTGYIGGTGDEPTENVGLYYMAGGFTSDKDLAVNFKGDTVQAMIYVRDDYNQLPTPLNPNTLYFISKDA